jgi:uncharacterized protein (AIM24 family)
MLGTSMVIAQSRGDFRSASSGEWTNSSIWQVYDGSKWISAATSPGDSAMVVTISDKTNVVISARAQAKTLVIRPAGKLRVEKGAFLICSKGMKAEGQFENFGIIYVE